MFSRWHELSYLDPLCYHVIVMVGVAPPDVHSKGLQLAVCELRCVQLQLELLLMVDRV